MKSDHVPGNAFSMEKEQIRKLGYEIVDIITDELDDPARRPIYPRPYDWDELEPVLGGDAPEYGQDPHELLRVVRDTLIPASANYIHPRLLGYVSSTPLPMTGLIEALVASIRLFPYTWNMTPGSSFIEATVARWLGQMVGYSDTAAGYMTTGGSWANLMGIAVARVRKAGWDIKADGMTGHPALIAYTANQAHSCHEQIIKLLGLGERQLRKIPVDSRFRIDLRALEATIRADLESGLKPFCVIANAGTTNTGAVDPLNAIADLAEAFESLVSHRWRLWGFRRHGPRYQSRLQRYRAGGFASRRSAQMAEYSLRRRLCVDARVARHVGYLLHFAGLS